MPGKSGESTAGNTLVLQENLGVAEAAEFCAALRAVNTGQDLNLDGSRVATIDTAGLQLLVSLCVQVRGNGHEVVWQAPSSVLKNLARLTGLAGELGLNAA